jgi:hypothetical protein
MSKNKGNNFERDVASNLSDIFGMDFSRTLSSGAYIGGKNQHRKSKLSGSMVNASLGDICTPDDWNFVIECKAYKDMSFHNLLRGYDSQINGWLNEVLFDAEDGDHHMLVFKINLVGVYFALPYVEYYHKRLVEMPVAHALYTHYYGEQLEKMRRYIILDWNNLYGTYNDEFPEVQEVLKTYIKTLATQET